MLLSSTSRGKKLGIAGMLSIIQMKGVGGSGNWNLSAETFLLSKNTVDPPLPSAYIVCIV
jgi:hypothetical protein